MLIYFNYFVTQANAGLRTGATGYIGGQVLKELTRSHPEYKIAALIRDRKVAQEIATAFPSVRPVLASLDDVQIVEEEASKAKVVLRMQQL